MSTSTLDLQPEEGLGRRILGTYDTGKPGPTLLTMGGIHGNEPGGVKALERVMASLHANRPQGCGRVVAIAGNLGALAQRTRFLDRDLNRLWLASTIRHLLSQDPELDCTEDREQRELLAVFEECRASARGPLVFLDLHSSSADGPPFTCVADTLVNRAIAMAIPAPLILGLEEAIDGAVMDWFTNRGLTALAVEGGQHDAPSTTDHLEAAVWVVLVKAGVLEPGSVDLAPYLDALRAASPGLPPVVEIRHRQVIRPNDGFRMVPGFTSFQPVSKGETLAADYRGEIKATESGRVLLPLYQGKGDDGFFLCRDVKPLWLRVARWVRLARLDRFAHWLPGVTRSPNNPNVLVVDPRIARWHVVEVFHLLGFRRRRSIGGRLTFMRRWSETDAEQLYDG